MAKQVGLTPEQVWRVYTGCGHNRKIAAAFLGVGISTISYHLAKYSYKKTQAIVGTKDKRLIFDPISGTWRLRT